ncbi:MAG TPA: ribosome assembly RNA-binding protein YhbY [Gemmatimonadaceae bacterium]|nr:ribosome assembly RNA-binding protein YhbY [Gemmatimonadaceae bacterium]
MTMRGKDRAGLRAEAHHLKPTVHVGQHGVSDTVVQALDEALAARELVKVQLGRNAPLDVKTAANALAARLGAEIVQVIGRTTTLYRENEELERKPGAPPPWRV